MRVRPLCRNPRAQALLLVLLWVEGETGGHVVRALRGGEAIWVDTNVRYEMTHE